MGAKAYVLIQMEAGKAAAAVEDLRQRPGVSAADLVIVPYDIIIVAEATDTNSIAKLVLNVIHGIPGVTRTLTCMVAGEG
jgi:DNA-binding Lrp family transcriptional regulator